MGEVGHWVTGVGLTACSDTRSSLRCLLLKPMGPGHYVLHRVETTPKQFFPPLNFPLGNFDHFQRLQAHTWCVCINLHVDKTLNIE